MFQWLSRFTVHGTPRTLYCTQSGGEIFSRLGCEQTASTHTQCAEGERKMLWREWMTSQETLSACAPHPARSVRFYSCENIKNLCSSAKENIFIKRVQMRHEGARAFRRGKRRAVNCVEIESGFAKHSLFGAFSSRRPTFAQSCMHQTTTALSSAAVGLNALQPAPCKIDSAWVLNCFFPGVLIRQETNFCGKFLCKLVSTKPPLKF